MTGTDFLSPSEFLELTNELSIECSLFCLEEKVDKNRAFIPILKKYSRQNAEHLVKINSLEYIDNNIESILNKMIKILKKIKPEYNVNRKSTVSTLHILNTIFTKDCTNPNCHQRRIVCLFRHNIYVEEENELHFLHKDFLILDRLKQIKKIEKQIQIFEKIIESMNNQKISDEVSIKINTLNSEKKKLLDMIETFY
jgi:tRNA/tmRNA/rRNA uracil-C5-methylase (TrmA/RlmC/RlmD family)